jgi:MerR family mercuric resistance operon transcriptional regulator
MEILTIGQLAKQAGVNIETIRYYERQGLLPEPPRRASGYRQYSAEFVKRIQFIKRAQTLGFSLKEIAELLDLRIESDTACDQVWVAVWVQGK